MHETAKHGLTTLCIDCGTSSSGSQLTVESARHRMVVVEVEERKEDRRAAHSGPGARLRVRQRALPPAVDRDLERARPSAEPIGILTRLPLRRCCFCIRVDPHLRGIWALGCCWIPCASETQLAPPTTHARTRCTGASGVLECGDGGGRGACPTHMRVALSLTPRARPQTSSAPSASLASVFSAAVGPAACAPEASRRSPHLLSHHAAQRAIAWHTWGVCAVHCNR